MPTVIHFVSKGWEDVSVFFFFFNWNVAMWIVEDGIMSLL